MRTASQNNKGQEAVHVTEPIYKALLGPAAHIQMTSLLALASEPVPVEVGLH